MKNVLGILSETTYSAVEFALLSFRLSLSILGAGLSFFLPSFKKSLLGETVLITGAGHGIGRELAQQLASMGCIVICWDNDKDSNLETRNAILEEGGEVYDFVVDVSNRIEVRETAKLMRKYGVPDITILINNAAIHLHKSFFNHNSDDVERTFNVNVLSHFWTIGTFLPSMLQNEKGHIISICNFYGFNSGLKRIPYYSSELAVSGLMQGLREEFQCQSSIHFTTIFPFYVGASSNQDTKYKFPWLFGIVTQKKAANEIITAIQRNYKECFIPKSLYSLNYLMRLLPESSGNYILNFLSKSNNNCHTS